MPIFYFECEECSHLFRKILDVADELCDRCQGSGELQSAVMTLNCFACKGSGRSLECPKCNHHLVKRITSAPTTSIVERLDNGLMTRPVERPADSERLFRERSQNSEQIKELY